MHQEIPGIFTSDLWVNRPACRNWQLEE